jgi:uncharacterized protein
MRSIFLWLALLPTLAMAAEVIPPAPERYFNDYAHVVSPATANELNQKLEQFERDTSSQILVAVYPKMESDSSIEDYTVRVAQSWRAGQSGKKNGAVLFVFVQDHKLYIQVGYGLEGALPDALAKQIIDNEITPRFRAGDFDGGLRAGVTAILQAAKGEYKGTGNTVAGRFARHRTPIPLPLMFFIAFMISGLIGRLLIGTSRGTVYSSVGRAVAYGALSGMWSGGGGYSSGGGGGGSGGGGFSGGGGSFGGGGAGGSW